MSRWRTFLSLVCLLLSTQCIALPTITAIDPPAFGPSRTTQSPSITVLGSGFTGTTAVFFGEISILPENVIVLDDHTILIRENSLPPTSPGTVAIRVTANGTSLPNHPYDYFTYQDNWIAYVPDFNGKSGDGYVYAFDTELENHIATLSSGSGSEQVVLTPDGKYAYCVNYRSCTLTIIDTAQNSDDFTIDFFLREYASSPIGIAISPGEGNVLLISDFGDGNILHFDITDRTSPRFVTRYSVGENGFPVAVAFLPDTKSLIAYSTNFGGKSITVIDADKQTIIGNYTDSNLQNPAWIALSTTKLSMNGYKTMVLDDSANQALFYSNLTPPGPQTPAIVKGLSLNEDNFFPQILPSPDATIAYVTNTRSGNISRIDLTGSSPVLLPENIATPPLVNGISITPDGLKGFAGNGSSSNKITIFDTATLETTTKKIGNEVTNPGITPDQAPVAYLHYAFLDSKTVQFDGIASLSPTGSISKYEWDFGDGTPLLTLNASSPNPPPHTFAPRSTPYTVTLTVTNDAGTSTAQTFFGQMVYNNGGPQAGQSIQLTIGGQSTLLPPTNASITQDAMKLLAQTCYYNIITFSPPSSESIPPVGYEIYRDEGATQFVGEVSATEPLVFSFCESKKHMTYYLFSKDATGALSKTFTKVSI
jgi:DNA-binding beta-propeller fold protein YncE